MATLFEINRIQLNLNV